MDSANATPVVASSVHRFNEIFSAIIGHHSLRSTMQMIADAFVAMHPSKAIAIFLLEREQFHLQAEAGLPEHLAHDGNRAPAGPVPVGSCGDLAASCPAFREILQSGVTLCLASPLISASGESRGAITVFNNNTSNRLLDDATRESICSLCDLARLAIEHRQLHEEVVHQSHYDRLTGLPNRHLLEDRLGQALIIAKRMGTRVAVCCIDLDRFKQINGSLGHDLGDVFLKMVGQRLDLSIRSIDTLARHGGDEFILVLRDLAEISDATNICDRLLKDLSAPFLIGGHSITMTASIGVSTFPDHGDTLDFLLRNADMAMRAAKHAGKDRVQIYSAGLGRQSRRAGEIVEALVSALAQAQFCIAYQPIYTLDKDIMGFEALLRWKHPTWGQISPLEFIPIAEKSGLIVAIGDWVIDEVCRQAMEWQAAAAPPVKIFANISGVQLGRPDFNSKIADALQRSGLPPDRLELEITESWIISDLRAAATKLQKLRDLGIGVAIDDFGTGYSTFSYLQELPLDTLKIDRSFIHRLDGSAANLSTVRAITGLAKQLGLRTVAEGVENEQHLAQLREIGCELMQGYFLARPLKPQAACALLKKQQTSKTFLEVAAKNSFAKRPPAVLIAG